MRAASPSENHSAPRRRWAFGLALAALVIGLASASGVRATTLESRVSTSSDDAEEPVGAAVNLSSSDLELIRDGSTDQTVGMRWTGITIPRGATISRAYIQFSAKESRSDPHSLTLRAEAADNAPTFTSALGNISTRTLTGAAVAWAPAAWVVGETGAAQQTPDLSSVIQEIVNRGGWASGNALVIVVNGTGRRTAWSFNGNAALAPLLHIEYGGGSPPPPVDLPPVARLSVAQIASPPLTVTADGSASTDSDATPIASYRFDFGDGTTPVTTTAPVATANHTYAAAGTYTVTLTATDTGGLTSTPVSASVTVNPPASASTIERRTASSSDDAEEPLGSSVSLSSSDLELILDSTDQTVGMRWTGLTIPRGATISRAYIQFGAKESRSDAVSLTFRGQAADNAPTFTSTAGNITTRPLTAAAVGWSPGAWVSGEAGAAQQTPDLSGVIQEIVNRGGWASGNSLVMVVSGSGSGRRTGWAYNGNPALAPLLHIEYGGGSPPPPGDAPPVARLSVAPATSPPLTVTADASASTDTDATPIASYRFDFGDGTSPVTTTAPVATANHTYAASGTYTVTLTVTDTGGLTSAPVTASVTVTASSGVIAVYAGYYDTHHPNNLRAKPSPWRGASNVVFVGSPDPGSSNEWDSSALRIDNLGSSSITVSAFVDMGTKTFSLWGSNTVPAGRTLILAQTGYENFDGSDTSPAGCYGCNPKLCLSAVNSFRPVVRLTINGVTTNYIDTGQVLNTHGVDMAGCPYTGTRNDESHSWTRIYPGSVATGPASNKAASTEAPQKRLSFAPPSPNPNRGDFYIRFVTPLRGPVRLSLYDPMGRLVRTYLDEELGAGEYRGRIVMSGDAAGIYYLKLWTPEETVSRQVVLAR